MAGVCTYCVNVNDANKTLQKKVPELNKDTYNTITNPSKCTLEMIKQMLITLRSDIP